MTQIFLLVGSSGGSPQQFPDPGDWNPVNKIEVIGAGAYGQRGFNVQQSTNGPGGGGGGGGGGYGVANNVVISSWPVQYYVFNGDQTGNTYICNFGGKDNNGTGAYVTGPGGTYSLGTSSRGYGGAAGKPSGYAGGNGGFNSSQYLPP